MSIRKEKTVNKIEKNILTRTCSAIVTSDILRIREIKQL